MALMQMVNGIEVAMSDEDSADLMAQWAATDAAAAANLAAHGYQAHRAQAYLDIGDQLDMLWHSMDTGEIPKSVAFYNARAAVKSQFPKPASS